MYNISANRNHRVKGKIRMLAYILYTMAWNRLHQKLYKKSTSELQQLNKDAFS